MLEVALSTTNVVVTLLALVIAVVVWYYRRDETATDVTSTAENGTDVKAVKSDEARPKAQKNLEQRKKGKAKDAFQHAWLICSLHGHTGPINDFTISPDGKRLLSISGRDFIVWHTKDWETSEHAADRSVVNFDTPTRVAFASDSKSVAVSLKNDKKLSIFQLIRRQGKSSYVVEHFEKVQFEVGHREQDITRIAVSSNNKFFVSASSDCHVVIYDFTGHILDRLDPKVNHLYDVVISPDAKYLAVAGFTSDVLVYEVEFSREGAYKGVKKAFNIVGQNSGVFAVSFSQYSDRALTVSKDGYWRLFDTHMRSNDDAPRLLSKGEWSALRSSTADNVHASLSPSGRSFAIAIDGALRLYCGEDSVKTIGDTGILCESFFKEKVLDEGNVGIAYSPCGRMVVLAGGRVIRVFKNIPETLGDVAFYEKALKEMSGADPKKRRVEEQLAEARQKLSEALK